VAQVVVAVRGQILLLLVLRLQVAAVMAQITVKTVVLAVQAVAVVTQMEQAGQVHLDKVLRVEQKTVPAARLVQAVVVLVR
jgi:hypothetical protein